MSTSSTEATSLKVNLTEVIEEMFLVLTNKEKDVIVKRFSLDNKPRRTLESIGQQFSVTRERVRQIEKIALNKLRRTVQASRLKQVNDVANSLLEAHGGVLLDTMLVSRIMRELMADNAMDAHIVRLALNINGDIERVEKNTTFHPFWRLKSIPQADINQVIKAGIKALKKKGDVLSDDKIVVQIRQLLGDSVAQYTDHMLLFSMETDKRVKRIKDEGFGLMSWRHINPKSIRDKAYIVLKRASKPLHFVEIANRISEAGFDKKVVTTQAVHNELIRYDQFVLVGRGLYALKEDGYTKGTVADIIRSLLKKQAPLTKQEIIEGVLKQRQVKKGTISLNLQKNPEFMRVGRAVYALDPKAKA